MATTITTTPIYGLTSVNSPGVLYLFVDVDIGGSPAPDGTQVGLRVRVGPGFTGGTFFTLTTEGGFAVHGTSVGGTQDREYQGLENTGGSVSTWTPNGAPAIVSWPSSGGSVPSYVPSAPTLTAIPGSSKVVLVWTPATPIDPSPLSQNHVYIDQYIIHRGTSPGFTNTVPEYANSGGGTHRGATTHPVTVFRDTGVTNGTTYYYHVIAAQNLEPQTAAFHTYSSSNEASATPRAQRVYMGAVVRA